MTRFFVIAFRPQWAGLFARTAQNSGGAIEFCGSTTELRTGSYDKILTQLRTLPLEWVAIDPFIFKGGATSHVELVRRIRREFPQIKILGFTTEYTPGTAASLLKERPTQYRADYELTPEEITKVLSNFYERLNLQFSSLRFFPDKYRLELTGRLNGDEETSVDEEIIFGSPNQVKLIYLLILERLSGQKGWVRHVSTNDKKETTTGNGKTKTEKGGKRVEANYECLQAALWKELEEAFPRKQKSITEVRTEILQCLTKLVVPINGARPVLIRPVAQDVTIINNLVQGAFNRYECGRLVTGPGVGRQPSDPDGKSKKFYALNESIESPTIVLGWTDRSN